MTSRVDIEKSITSLFAARLRGDLEGVMRELAPDATFRFNGRGTRVAALGQPSKGTAAIKPIVQQLIDTWRFDDWRQRTLLIDGERALLHWSAVVTCIPTGRTERFDVFDLITFHNGKIVDYHQSTDTALMMALAG
ncbi:MAG: nuclear transport factor 2 family protein [Alphaproteobacteria bacterium]|nr:nuclear transport factor 2 family protein [Alphaproteobacteria bacterium]